MWIFVKYGFYSIACAAKPDGTPDPATLMIRGRTREHMQNLQSRFPALADFTVVVLLDCDYKYRMIVPKSVWVPVLAELAQEQTWSNFKNQATDYAGRHQSEYIDALHRVWSIMFNLQD